MAIDFSKLPGSKPSSNVPKACYIGVIESAEMKAPKNDPTKKKYLNMRLGLSTPDGKSVGKIFDSLFDSDAALAQFKLSRFITALELPITGDFELADLTKMIVNKRLLVDVCPEKKDGQPTGRDTVDVFTGDIYYSLAEASRKLEGVTLNQADNRINAPDAADAGDDPY